MRTTDWSSVLILCGAVAIVSAACNGASGALGPTGPSKSSGAQVTGLVRGLAAGASTSSSRSLASTALTTSFSTAMVVSVSGTKIESQVDGAGQFALTGVPSGTVELNFRGAGVDDHVTLTDVRDGDRITLEVQVEGDHVRVESEDRHHEDGEVDDDERGEGEGEAGEVESEGAVSNLSGTCPDLTFTIGTRSVHTDKDTVFEDIACPDLQNAVRVEVEGQLEANGSLMAASIELED